MPVCALALMGALVAPAAGEFGASHAAAPASGPEAILYTRLCGQVAARYDSTHGGWVTHGGEPSANSVALALAQTRDGGPAFWRSCALHTIDWTWALYDSVGGGFLQRSANVRHNDPSFEKRTDSNAERLENLIEAWQLTGDDILRRRTARVADYFDRVLADGRGGYVDGQVADRNLVPRSNGMAIRAWIQWAAATANPRARDFGLKSLDRTWTECWVDSIGMLRHNAFGEVSAPPQLADQIEMGRAYVIGAHLGSRESDLKRAVSIGELIEHNFADPKKGTWRTQAMADHNGKIRAAAADPAENARAALFLAELASLTGEGRWREAARRGITAWSGNVDHSGDGAGDWALAIRALEGADLPQRPEWKTDPVQHTPTSKSYPAKKHR
ncbi:MAG: hypothetical protein ACRENS_00435 [Candidatus Eiseniibacteriota bacterium]